MSILKKNTVGVKAARNAEDMAADIAKLAANQDYIAMMTDVELEENDDDIAESGDE